MVWVHTLSLCSLHVRLRRRAYARPPPLFYFGILHHQVILAQNQQLHEINQQVVAANEAAAQAVPLVNAPAVPMANAPAVPPVNAPIVDAVPDAPAAPVADLFPNNADVPPPVLLLLTFCPLYLRCLSYLTFDC